MQQRLIMGGKRMLADLENLHSVAEPDGRNDGTIFVASGHLDPMIQMYPARKHLRGSYLPRLRGCVSYGCREVRKFDALFIVRDEVIVQMEMEAGHEGGFYGPERLDSLK